jgi:hypothetical protein
MISMLYGGLKTEYKYQHSISLSRHPDHIDSPSNPQWGRTMNKNSKTGRDPRKVWCYDCCTGKFAVDEIERYQEGTSSTERWTLQRIYYFENEQDLLMFTLRWASENVSSTN